MSGTLTDMLKSCSGAMQQQQINQGIPLGQGGLGSAGITLGGQLGPVPKDREIMQSLKELSESIDILMGTVGSVEQRLEKVLRSRGPEVGGGQSAVPAGTELGRTLQVQAQKAAGITIYLRDLLDRLEL